MERTFRKQKQAPSYRFELTRSSNLPERLGIWAINVKTGNLRNETAVDGFLRLDTIGRVEGWHGQGNACNSN